MTYGVEVRTRLARVPKGIPVNTGTLFVTGATTSGSVTAPAECHNMADFEAAYGVRAAGNQALYDYVDAAFGEGVTAVFVGRKGSATAAVDEKQTITEASTTGGTLDAALLLLRKDLGPGQIAAVGETANATTFDKLLTHASVNNRFALLDVGSGDDVVAMTTLGNTLAGRSSTLTDRGALFGPWATIPPPVGVAGSTSRTVPEAACEPFVFRPIDAQGKLAAAVRGAVDGILLELYSNDGLYGETAGEAFDTVVNATINPDSQIAQGQLRAISEVRFSMHAKSILIDLVTVPITGQITA
jgi:hypothetical protein